VASQAARLKAIEQQLIAKLSVQALTELDKEKLDEFIKEADKLIDENYDELQKDFDHKLLGEYVSEDTAKSLTFALGSKSSASLPSADYIASLNSDVMVMNAPASAWWRGQSEKLKLGFSQQVRQGLTSAETNQQIISRIVGRVGQPGIMEIARKDAATLVQTSVQAVANDARRKTFEANADVIKGIMQVSTLDSHTSLICISYSGCEWDLEYKPIGPKDKQKPFNGGTPRHFNCRSVEVPVLKTLEDLGIKGVKPPLPGQRASELGPIDINTSFDDFLKRRGKAYQDEMLGEGRAQLWRDGKLTLRDLVNAKGRPLTLGELQATAHAKDIKAFSGAAYMKKFDKANVTPDSIIASFPADTRAKIAATKARLEKLTSTVDIYKKGDIYTPERAALHNKILYEGVEGYDPDTGGKKWYNGILNQDAVHKASVGVNEKPTFTILGGRGGSGKSAFSGVDEKTGLPKFPEAKVYDKEKAIVFDSDHIKHMLPEFAGFNANQVHEESSFILQEALDIARQQRLNIVLDGTLKSSAADKIALFKADGYRTEAHYMHLPRDEAAKRAVARYLGPTGRYVPAEIILGNVNNEANFDELRALVDDWSFRDNNVPRGKPPKLIARKFK